MAGRILLVGAEPDDLPWLRRTLAAGYFSVTESPDFRGALATAAAIQPDIIMIDLGVSAEEGLSLCRRIIATEWLSGAPVVLITRDASGEETAAGFEAQADDFLRKPIEPTLLLARLRALA
ncbi:MAG: response regulator, partial [Pseudomonadota bacterium]